MRNVAPPMIRSVTRKAYLRPTRSPMQERAEGTRRKPGPKCRQRGEQRGYLIAAGVEVQGNHRSQAAEDIEVIPFNHRAHGRGADDPEDAGIPLTTCGCGCWKCPAGHTAPPSVSLRAGTLI